MNTVTLRKWDTAEQLKTTEDIVLYLEACVEEAGDDAVFLAKALGDVARAKGMTEMGTEAGRDSESLYQALSGEANPSFDTILKAAKALGLRVRFELLPESD